MVPSKALTALFVLASFFLSGCAETTLISHYAKKVPWGEQGDAGNYKIGKPYKVSGVWYTPKESFNSVETGIASWYGPDFHGGRTANGEMYDQNELTAAHRTLQMPSFVRVTNLENGRSIVVRVNDRGPFLHGRIIDVSKRAAELLGFTGRGTARVRIEVLEKESRLVASAAQRGMDTSRMRYEDFQKMPASAPSLRPVAVAENNPRNKAISAARSDNEDLPESLQTPTITVEELADTGKPMMAREVPKSAPQAASSVPLPVPAPSSFTSVHKKPDGRLMPDHYVSTAPVRPTALYIQAGAFSVKNNADMLAERLSKIAPAFIDPLVVNGRTLYRVKLGPISSISAADDILEKVVRAGGGGAHVVKRN